MSASLNKTKNQMVGRLSLDKESHLLDVARDLIIAEGLSATTMDKIAKAAGVSKATLYRRFDNKMQLFELLSIQMIKNFVQKIDQLEMDTENPRKVLLEVGRVVKNTVADPKHTSLLRELIAEIPRNQHLNHWVKTDINPIVPNRLISFFNTLIAQGRMDHPNSVDATSSFMTLCSDGYQLLLDTQGGQKDIDRRLESDIDMFMKGCGISFGKQS